MPDANVKAIDAYIKNKWKSINESIAAIYL